MSDTKTSETPRTDAAEIDSSNAGEYGSFKCVKSDFARQLERELNEAKLLQQSLGMSEKEKLDGWNKCEQERNQLRAELEKVREDLRESMPMSLVKLREEKLFSDYVKMHAMAKELADMVQIYNNTRHLFEADKLLTRFTELEKSK